MQNEQEDGRLVGVVSQEDMAEHASASKTGQMVEEKLAGIYDEVGEPERAIELYELAAQLLEVAPNRQLVQAYSRLAELLEAAGRKDDALRVLKRAVGVQAESGRLLAGTE